MQSSMCSTCHTDGLDGTWTGLANINANDLKKPANATEALLAEYISASMPQGNPGNCVDTCASDIAAYIWSYRTSTNLVTNGSAEYATAVNGVDVPWPWFTDSGVTLAQSNAQAYDGSNSVLLSGRTETYHAAKMDMLQAGMIPGNDYLFKSWVRMAQGEAPATINFSLKVTDDATNYLYIAGNNAVADDAWTPLVQKMTYTTTAGAVSELYAYLESPTATASFYVDKLEITPWMASNFVVNGDVEAVNMAPWGAAQGGTAAISADAARSGSQGILMSGRTNDYNAATYDAPPFKAGELYELSVWVKMAPGVADTNLVLVVYSQDDTQHWTWVGGLVSVTENAWVELKGTYFYNPVGASQALRVMIQSDAGGATNSFYVDDLTIMGEPVSAN